MNGMTYVGVTITSPCPEDNLAASQVIVDMALMNEAKRENLALKRSGKEVVITFVHNDPLFGEVIAAGARSLAGSKLKISTQLRTKIAV